MSYTVLMQNDKYTVGSDPEFMVSNGRTIVSAIPFMKGDKYQKEDLKDDFFVYDDNVNVECNVPPSSNPDEFVGTMATLFQKLKKAHPEFKVTTTASHTFTKQECEHDHAKKFGCDPEFCAYVVDTVQPPQGGHTFRSAGGHIHLGNKTFNLDEKQGYLLDFDDKIQAILLMDLFVGIPMVMMDNDPTSQARKQLYGKAGRFRPTKYGVEYRTPSPYWLTHPRITSIVAKLTFKVMDIGDNKQGAETLEKFDMSIIREAIDTNNKELAAEVFNNLPIEDDIKAEILELSATVFSQEVDSNW